MGIGMAKVRIFGYGIKKNSVTQNVLHILCNYSIKSCVWNNLNAGSISFD